MGPAWLLLLLPSLLGAQVTPDVTPGFPVETGNSTADPLDPLTNSTGSSNSSGPPEPTEAPTEFVDDWLPAETFMYTADPSSLEPGRCSRAYSSAGQAGSLPRSFAAPLRPALDALANTANFLNMIFQASDLRESTVREDMEWYHALVRALLEDDVLIRSALLTFDADPASPAPQLVLRASRNATAKARNIVLQDLSRSWDALHPPAPAPDDSWFTRFKFPDSDRPTAGLSKRVLLNDLSTLDTPKWRQGDSYVTNRSGVRWASAPFLDCRDRRFVPGWMLTLSTSFYGLKPDLTPEFRGVIRVDVNIQDIDLDQCATGDGWFADTHECNRTTMECVPVPGKGFRLGQYCCRCQVGYYNPEIPPSDSGANAAGGPANGSACYPSMPVCLPCWPGCRSCQDGAPCWVQETRPLRATVLAVQGLFMLLIFVSMLVAYRHRRNRRIRASGLLLLETILFGSLLLYFPVFIMYFKPSTFRCILLRWVRMLGFSIVYGTVTLKMYRVLKVFLSRTAQRVPYMSSLHLLRILGVMLMAVSWFLCAWTVGVLQNRDRNIPVFVTTATSDGQGFNLCYLDRWDYMMAVAELLFLCWGSSLWTAVRPVPSAFHEPRYMGIAIHNELLLSTMFHLFRFTFSSLHPDWMLLLSFTHTHVTITVTLALLFIPKFLYVSKRGTREEIAAEVYEDEVDLRRSGSYLNSSFHSAWSEPNVDPEDFRDELKKLYAQLEVNKTKKMTANNPHLSKKRSSRCALGRSIIRRIAEIPESMGRQCSRDEKEGSFQSKSVIQSDSFRKAPDAVSVCLSSKSSIKTPPPIMRKSISDHHNMWERESSLHDSMLKANAVNRSSRQSDTDSLDIRPGVCKSASALNLTIDTNLLHPDHTRLQKSLSLTSTATHSIEDIPKVNRASTVITRSRQRGSISEQTMSALQSESFDKAEVCPWEMEPAQSVDKNQKHVTYATSQDSEEATPKSPDAIICPWDHLPPVEKTPSEDKEERGGTDSPKPQGPVSASAPASPRPKFTKDERVFSFRTTANKWLSVKSIIGTMEAGSKAGKEGTSNTEDGVSQKSQESASSTPRSSLSTRRPSVEKKVLQKRSMTTDGKPCLVKQNAIRLSSGDSSDRSPRRLVIVKSAVHPWNVDDMQKDGTYENVFLSRQSSKRSSTSSWETASSCRTPSTHRRGSNRITPIHNVSQADVCPWEGPGNNQEGDGLKKQQSIKADVCPWESVSEPSNVCPWESQEQGTMRRQGTERGNLCPWETQDIPVICHTNVSRDSQTQQSVEMAAQICPWETAGSPPTANVCPWDVQADVVYENLNPLANKGKLTVPSALHPTGSIEMLSNEQQSREKSPAPKLGRQLTNTTESCPWDFPDPPKNLDNICPWEEGNPEQTKTESNSQITVKADICPWDTGHQDKPEIPPKVTKMVSQGHERVAEVCPWDSGEQQAPKAPESHIRQDTVVADVCPWDTEEAGAVKTEVSRGPEKQQRQETLQENVCPWDTTEPKVLKKQDSSKANVCPWETEEPKVVQKQDTSKENVCPWETEEPKVVQKQDTSKENVCPWETEEPKVVQKQDTSKENVCPWETEEPKVLKRQESSKADVCPWETEEPKVVQKQDTSKENVCPWETEEPKVVQKQDTSKENVCPWETEEPKVLKKQDSSKADVCPWETEEPKVLKRQESSKADVCPWETEEPKVVQKQDTSKENVCPWETEEPKVVQKQDTSKENVCPWETEEPKVLKKQDSSKADVCPWETEEPKVLKRQESSKADVCPWETEEPKVLKKQDSSKVDVCPWETEEPKVLKAQESVKADVCPWETEEPKVLKKQDSSKADVCPWETEEPQTSTESKVDIPKNEVAEDQGTCSVGETHADIGTEQADVTKETLGRRDALRAWEMERSRSGSYTDNNSDVFTWEPENIPEEDEEDDDAECAAEAFIFPADL